MFLQDVYIKKWKIIGFVNIFLVVVFSSASAERDVFGFRWKMTHKEASRMVSNIEIRPEYSVFGNTHYIVKNPRNPLGAESIGLIFFNDELYMVNIKFAFDTEYESQDKANKILMVLKSKYLKTKVEKIDWGSGLFSRVFNYKDEESGDITENPYNLESITVMSLGSGGKFYILVNYRFYGSEDIETHIQKMKDKEEFGGF